VYGSAQGRRPAVFSALHCDTTSEPSGHHPIN
jgi:hypothetical protein